MTIQQRNFALAEMEGMTDRDAWLSDVAMSYYWGDPEGAEVPQERIDELSRLWDVVHLPVRELVAPLTLTEASRTFFVPYRTMQNWFLGVNPCPVYVRFYLGRLAV